jgi:hypothetical protein
VTAYFTAQGSGRDVFRALCGRVLYGDVHQCWEANACLNYVDDPFAFTAQCNTVKPCLLGSKAACPQ